MFKVEVFPRYELRLSSLLSLLAFVCNKDVLLLLLLLHTEDRGVEKLEGTMNPL